jgi:hypothetical protein
VVYEDERASYIIDMREVQGWSTLEDLRDQLLDTFVLTAADWFDREGCVSTERMALLKRRFLTDWGKEAPGHEDR